MGKLLLERKVIGMVGTNVYLAVNTQTQEAFLVDPADNAGLIEDWIREKRANLKAILLTHGHFDHTGAVMQLKADLQVPIYAMQAERALLEDAQLNVSGRWANAFTVKADRFLTDGATFSAAGFDITVFHTPGHTRGGACYYIASENVLFSGDTIFCESVGRTDLPTGNSQELMRSVRNILTSLPEDTAIYPGHDEETTVAHEKRYNPYI